LRKPGLKKARLGDTANKYERVKVSCKVWCPNSGARLVSQYERKYLKSIVVLMER
jgi:hypothetical protein